MEQEERFRLIEERLSALEQKLTVRSPSINQQPPQPPPPPFNKEEEPSRLSLWFSEKWLMSICIFLVLLSVSWFIGYAFSNDLLGETARICLSFTAGIIAYIWGFILLRKTFRGGQALI